MTVEKALARARVLADLDRAAEAEALIAQALASEPDNEDGLSLLGSVLTGQYRFTEAHAAAERLLRAHPDSLRGLLLMARLKYLLKRPYDGIVFARRAVELYPGNVYALGTLADVLQRTTHGSAEALGLLAQARAIAPEEPYAYGLAGHIHLGVRQYAEAETWLLRALARRPQDPWAVLDLAMARAGLGRFEESRDEVAQTLRLDSSPDAISDVIERIEAQGLPGHLGELYRMALSALGRPDLSEPGSAGDDPELLAAQGKLAWRLYSWDASDAAHRKAGRLAEAVLAAAPDNPDARYVQARRLCAENRGAEALPIARQLRAEGYPSAHFALVLAYQETRDYDAALAVISERLALNPDDPVYLRAQAHTLRHLKRYDEALAVARRTAELSPSGPDVQLQLGICAREAGDPELAERALRQAMADAPGEGAPAAELAVALALADRWPEAGNLIASLDTDLPDPEQVVRPCLMVAERVFAVASPKLIKVLEDGPDGPEELDEAARWLDLLLRVYRLTVWHPSGMEATANLPALVDVLRKTDAPPDSDFAATVRGLGELVEARAGSA